MGRFIWPCPSYTRISSRYGNRIHPITGKNSFHTGVDLACAKGKSILAARAGSVSRASYDKIYGNLVIVIHDDGYSTYYAHTSQMFVKKGDRVNAGQVIAKVGSTGYSTGNHLHFEVRINGVHKNPLLYVKDTDSLKNYKGTSVKTSSATGSNSKTEKQDISSVVLKSVSGETSDHSQGTWGNQSIQGTAAEILIQNSNIMVPTIVGKIVLSLARKGAAGCLTFDVLKDQHLNFTEGNPVRFSYQGTILFLGYVFEKSRTDFDTIHVVCYDQLRYLKNKDTMIYQNKTYADLLRMIGEDYHLKLGNIENTEYVIPNRIDEENTLMDILQNASDLTTWHTGKQFVLYDEQGKLNLKNINSMVIPIMISEKTCGGFSYKTTIDSETYNRIKIALDNDITGQREIYMAQDDTTQHNWGTLSLYEKLTDVNATAAMAKERAQVLLKGYNKKKRLLTMQNCLGDVRVRGGSGIHIMIQLGDIAENGVMIVEKVTHVFEDNNHWMNVTLMGGEYQFG